MDKLSFAEKLRDAAKGLAEELDEKRLWVHPYTQDDGTTVSGHWREGDPHRTMDRAAGTVMNTPGEDRPPWNPPLHKDVRQKIEDLGLKEWPKKGPKAQEVLGDYPDTQHKYAAVVKNDRGKVTSVTYTDPDRIALHKKIVEHFVGGHQKPSGKPIQLFYAGGTASGKSTALKNANKLGSSIVPDDAVLVNPDEIKAMLDEFTDMQASGDAYAASGVHEESSDIAKMVMREAQNRGLNIVVDGTGDSDRTKFLHKLTSAADNGYKVRVFMVDLPESVAIERMISRAEKPGPDFHRYVPIGEVQKMHRGAAGRHLNWRSLDIIDQWEVWSTNTPEYGAAVMAAKGGNGKFQVMDDYEYGRILQKAKRDPHKPI